MKGIRVWNGSVKHSTLKNSLSSVVVLPFLTTIGAIGSSNLASNRGLLHGKGAIPALANGGVFRSVVQQKIVPTPWAFGLNVHREHLVLSDEASINTGIFLFMP
ncbi:hypothetical protein H5410_020767 [Solanum commersonii]|uniref:Uncharacterized protein n=1 Tax=Solanum commersonii TaxID=4109 RepID=A0A9J5ZF75_SOLCO|nr:hypothetical protein H5410_020767 [Solanum commersonii]